MSNSFAENTDSITAICNSFGCFNKATLKIVLSVGSKSLTIFVCENCGPKFEDN